MGVTECHMIRRRLAGQPGASAATHGAGAQQWVRARRVQEHRRVLDQH